jgi:hypothetical protein
MRASQSFIFAAIIATLVGLVVVVQSNTSNARGGALPHQQPSPSPTPEVPTLQHSYLAADTVWPDLSVYVCWENPSPDHQKGMDLVRQSIASTWEAASELRFKGWKKCATENRGIRILIDDSGPHTKGLGTKLEGQPAGMVLNFTFKNWIPDVDADCKKDWELCMKSVAVHEFGHAIGFAHEHNRPDVPGECKEPSQGSRGTVLLTRYDPDSVMNYCNKKNKGVLSALDIEGVKKVYKKR